ncbi:MAG TPA: amidohydrolase family protein, partial [Geobacteraceae bacterium]|nr:amidohydrolase family protein [Geobacteraceae bacterium]
LHCFVEQRQVPDVLAAISGLRRAGIRHLAVAGMVNPHLDPGIARLLIPDFVELSCNPLCHEVEELLMVTEQSDQAVLPFVDTRCLWGEVPQLLKTYCRRGFTGIKGIYLADDGNDIGVPGVPELFGITVEQYHQREWEIFAFAQANDLPVLYHMDARRYGEVMRALLEDFPMVRVNFPHFGISRKALGGILDRYPNVYTDMANMLSHMQRDRESYRDFIMHYPDRVCFASDAFLSRTERVFDYLRLVKELALPLDVEVQLLSGNARSYLGSVLPVCSGS